jgi:hypothetical protein
VHALRNIHAGLVCRGIVVDTQPVSDQPPVASDGAKLGTLDMRDWLATIHAVDERFAETITAGLYELEHQSWIVVTDTYENGPECLETVSGWRATRVPSGVAQATRGHHVSRDGATRGTPTAAASLCLTAHGPNGAGCGAAAFAEASSDIVGAVTAARPIPTRLAAG